MFLMHAAALRRIAQRTRKHVPCARAVRRVLTTACALRGLMRSSVQVSLLATGQVLPAPVWLQPAGVARYYAQRKPPDLRGLLFSPYGIMIGAPRLLRRLHQSILQAVPAFANDQCGCIKQDCERVLLHASTPGTVAQRTRRQHRERAGGVGATLHCCLLT